MLDRSESASIPGKPPTRAYLGARCLEGTHREAKNQSWGQVMVTVSIGAMGTMMDVVNMIIMVTMMITVTMMVMIMIKVMEEEEEEELTLCAFMSHITPTHASTFISACTPKVFFRGNLGGVRGEKEG